MNMARIRHILEMRRACKAAPLLPKKRKSWQEGERRSGVKEILDVHLRICNLIASAETVMCAVYEKEEDGQWKMCTATENVPLQSECCFPAAFSLEFAFERPQPIRIEICEWSEESIRMLGCCEFLVASVVAQRGQPLELTIVKRAGDQCGTIFIECCLQPREQPTLFQFEVRDCNRKVVPEGSSVVLHMSRVSPTGEGETVYRSEAAKAGARMHWRQFTVQATSDPASILVIELFCRDEKGRGGLIAAGTTTLGHLKGEPLLYLTSPLYKEGRKACAVLEAIRCSEMAVFSMIDYLNFGASVHLAVAVDFSCSSPEPDHAAFIQDAELAIQALAGVFQQYPQTTFHGFGLGAQIPPQYRESHHFCLSLETDSGCAGPDGLLAAFRTACRVVRPTHTAHFAHIIYYISKIAQNALSRSDASRTQYFLLAIITRGDVDDLKEAVQALIFASRAPVSVLFIGAGGGGEMDEVARLGQAGKRLAFQGRKADRDLLQFVDISRCREEEGAGAAAGLADRALHVLPWQLATYMMKNGVVPRHNINIPQPPATPRTRSRAEQRARFSKRRSDSVGGSSVDWEDEREEAGSVDDSNIRTHCNSLRPDGRCSARGGLSQEFRSMSFNAPVSPDPVRRLLPRF